MKLLIITCIKEDDAKARQVFKTAQIPVYSVTTIYGHQTDYANYLPDSWFASSGEETESKLLFSFTEEAKAKKALELIKQLNEGRSDPFPLHGFILPVDSHEH